ncbi:MAG: Tex-like N-terminal domain-containing protein [Pirellulales bacterium]
MTELQAIARFLRRPEEQIRVAYDLIRQGYSPEFLATYRPDETGQLDRETLKKMRRLREYLQRVEQHRQFVKDLLQQEQLWGDSLEALIQEASTIAEIDLLTRGLRSRKSSRSLVDKQAEIATLGQALLTMEGETPADLHEWIANHAKVDGEEAKVLLSQVRRWLQLLLHEEPKLLDKIAKHLRRKSMVTVSMIQSPESGDDADPEASSEEAGEHREAVALDGSAETSETSPEANIEDGSHYDLPDDHSGDIGEDADASHEDVSHEDANETVEEVVATVPEGAEGTAPTAAATPGENLTFAPPKSKKGGKKSKAKETVKAKSESNLSPRQRRRRWLKSVLESYVKLRKPLDRLSPYQILMLGRGQRSQLIKLNLEYDIAPLIHAARESLWPGRHPLHHWLLELAEEGLRKQILPKLEQDLMAEYEEVAQQELLDMAVEHLEHCLQQKPVSGKTILAIDAIGPKSAALAVVDKQGKVLHTDEIACNSIRGDILTTNVTMLGEIIHRFHVDVLALSNGPARRFLIHTIKELLKQSSGRLQWVMVDRAGADAYCATRLCLQELPSISRRHRAAVWMARRLQDPLFELLKIDPARLRLGSYQRELPDAMLHEGLTKAVSDAIARRGVDVWNANEETLAQVPGVSEAIAKKIIAKRNAEELTTRHDLVESLKPEWADLDCRQAIGFLRIFGSDEPLDATAVHPDDYRLAQRLIANAGLAAPSNAPSQWKKPDLTAAVSAEPEAPASVETSSEEAAASVSEEASNAVDASSLDSVEVASEPTAETPVEAEVSTSPAEEGGEALSAEEAAPAEVEAVAVEPSSPEIAIDVEKLARGWQVGRERLRYVARALQRPFHDSRHALADIPMMDKVPSLDDLKPGMTAWAVVIGVADFGAFADLGPDCSGLIHVSRLSPNFVEDPHQVVQVGDLIQVWVVDVDAAKKRVALSALPPGMQQRPRREREGADAQEGGRRDSRGPRGGRPAEGQGQGQSQGHGQGGRRGDQRRDDGRRDQRGGKPGQGRGGQRRGDFRGGRNRRDDSDSTEVMPERKVKIDAPKPIQPISDAMQKGKEPLRSFSDLMQFYQVKREPGSEARLRTRQARADVGI